ncbi:MAG: polysaccharide deacetylase family protein [Ancalomicrobiaceae bacterium]|nr:polysaccharide deacetylase family protein [Ancalomicrobiaceae bacterium]
MPQDTRPPAASPLTDRPRDLPWLTRLADAVLGARGCLLTFHRGASGREWSGLPNRNFYLNLDFLDRLLAYLSRTDWDIVTIGEAVRRAGSPGLATKFVNFSIDDCYRDTYEAVVPVFRRHNVPVTLFVTTGIPDATLPLAFAGLEQLLLRDRVRLEHGEMRLASDEARRAAFDRIAARWDGPAIGEHYARFCAMNDVNPDDIRRQHAISWEMLEDLSRDPLVEIGAHSVSHPHISSLAPDAAAREIGGSRERLEARLGLPVRHFAFPYGRAADCGPRDFAIARQCGFDSASTTRKGLVRAGTPVDRLPRVTLNGNQQSLFLAEGHLSGVSGFLARRLGRV